MFNAKQPYSTRRKTMQSQSGPRRPPPSTDGVPMTNHSSFGMKQKNSTIPLQSKYVLNSERTPLKNIQVNLSETQLEKAAK